MPCSHDLTALVFRPGNRLGLGAAALWYASMGYAVVPIERGGKKPHRMLPATGGVHHATTDPAMIREWWSLDPAAGIGVATGGISALAVIDCDVKGGHDGLENLAAFCNENELRGLFRIHHSVNAQTPSGGVHIWLRLAGGHPERPGILPGVDLKGEGGYVVAPPSCRMIMPDDRGGERVYPIPVPYQFLCGCPCSLPLAPPWLGHWAATAISSNANSGMIEDAPDLDQLKQTGIAVGERNVGLYRLACSLYRRHGTDLNGSGKVLSEVEKVWRAGDTIGFTHRELLICIESARKYIAAQIEADELALRNASPWLRRHGL